MIKYDNDYYKKVISNYKYDYVSSFPKITDNEFQEKWLCSYNLNEFLKGISLKEKSIIDLKGEKRKKFFELLSQYKETGIYRVSLEEFKILLGFIEYVNKNEDGEDVEIKQLQLEFLFSNNEVPQNFEKAEYLKIWGEFKRVFLDPAIEEINKNSKLDIDNITYTTKKNRKENNRFRI